MYNTAVLTAAAGDYNNWQGFDNVGNATTDKEGAVALAGILNTSKLAPATIAAALSTAIARGLHGEIGRDANILLIGVPSLVDNSTAQGLVTDGFKQVRFLSHVLGSMTQAASIEHSQ